MTPLIRAAYHGHLKEVMALLAAGADKDATDEVGCYEVIDLEGWRTYRVRRESVGSHMREGARNFDPDLYVVSQLGNTALVWASHNGRLEVVLALLAARANKVARNKVKCQ